MVEGRILKINDKESRLVSVGDILVISEEHINPALDDYISGQVNGFGKGSKVIVNGFNDVDENTVMINVTFKGALLSMNPKFLRSPSDDKRVVNDIRRVASETDMMFASEEENDADKRIFVDNLGWLLAQTRERIEGCSLTSDGNYVTVYYKGGMTRKINITHDSYAAILREVINNCF